MVNSINEKTADYSAEDKKGGEEGSTASLSELGGRLQSNSVLMFFGKGANFINGLVNPIGLKGIGWKYYIVYVC